MSSSTEFFATSKSTVEERFDVYFTPELVRINMRITMIVTWMQNCVAFHHALYPHRDDGTAKGLEWCHKVNEVFDELTASVDLYEKLDSECSVLSESQKLSVDDA
jgi:hypothetical protein